MQTTDKRSEAQKINELQARLKRDATDRLYASAEIHHNDHEVTYNLVEDYEKDEAFKHEPKNSRAIFKLGKSVSNINDNIKFAKNVLKGLSIIVWRPFGIIWRFVSQKLTFYSLKIEQTNLFNTSLRTLLNSLFIIVFIVFAAILYRNGQISALKNTIIDKVGEWSGAAGINIQEVKSFGRRHTQQKDILAALNVKIGTPLLSFDVEKAKARLENIGWIKEAKIQRIMPDKLEVTIVEREPFAIWQINGKHHLVDRNGILVADEVLRGYHLLPLIVGKGAAKEALGLLSALEERPDIFQHIRALVRVGERRWDMDLKNGIRILLPAKNPEGMLADLERMILDHEIFNRGIKVIDFRLADRVRFEMDDATAAAYHEAKALMKTEKK